MLHRTWEFPKVHSELQIDACQYTEILNVENDIVICEQSFCQETIVLYHYPLSLL